MGNANSNTHVANATGSPIRVYYSVDNMRLEEVVVDIGVSGNHSVSGELSGSKPPSVNTETSGSVSAGTKLIFKPDSRYRYVRIPENDYCKFSGEGTLYASVFVESCNCSDECVKTISENFRIPRDRSFIVTRNHNIRFQKYGANIWVDEDGINHHS